MTDKMAWYRHVTGTDSVNAVAKRAGLVQTTLAAQVRKGELTPQSAVAIARAYQSDPLRALVAIGLVAADEVDAYARRVALGDVSDEELAREVWVRMSSGAASAPLTAPAPASAPEQPEQPREKRPMSMQEIKQQRLLEAAMPVDIAADDRPWAGDGADDWEPC